MMPTVRKYGHEPFVAAVIHGGPGAPGELSEVARELASAAGVLEPLQMADSVEGQVEELRGVLAGLAALPLTLIGFSWGAWLSTILAARHPHYLKKLVLVSSGPFEPKDAGDIMETRLRRLGPLEKMEAESLMARIMERALPFNAALERFGELMSKADAYAPLPRQESPLPVNFEIFKKVWGEAAEMRDRGELLSLARLVKCPVVAIHGDHDPHPGTSISRLDDVFSDFRFVPLKRCGHYPWMERYARDKFFKILKIELDLPGP